MPEIPSTTNRILAALPSVLFQTLSPKFERIPLVFGEDIYKPGEIIKTIYFPESGIISLLSGVEENSTLEVGIVGNEGIVGIPAYLGVPTANNYALVQGVGYALIIPAEEFIAECKINSELSRLLNLYVNSLITQISQSAACNRFHSIEERLARWLLMTHDRMQTDEFRITQEFLSNMLGVRREAVNKSASHFQELNLIQYSRGDLSILDRKGLEEISCTCYKIIKKDYDEFLT